MTCFAGKYLSHHLFASCGDMKRLIASAVAWSGESWLEKSLLSIHSMNLGILRGRLWLSPFGCHPPSTSISVSNASSLLVRVLGEVSLEGLQKPWQL